MRRALVAVAAGALALAAVVGMRLSSRTAAQGDEQLVPAQATPAALPIAQVVLFSSGVGYFQREGEVQGNARVDLTFPVQDINDLLKSMVLEDQGGGHISAVNYDSQAPIEKTLRSFAINLTNNPSFAEILYQARGEKVEIVLQQSATAQPGTLTGIIMGVEQVDSATASPAAPTTACKKDLRHTTYKKPAESLTVHGRLTAEEGGTPAEGPVVNLWCAEGLRSVKLGEVQRVRFLNPVLDSEVKKALEVLALAHDTQKKAVSLNCMGEGKRTVKVGYVVENPIWKTSYRLVLDAKGKPYLQGWAIVENTQDEDWNNVRMALVSGRPISFQMDLYAALSVARPVVEPELFASLRPPTYSGAINRRRADELAKNADELPTVGSAQVPIATAAQTFQASAAAGVSTQPLPTGATAGITCQDGAAHVSGGYGLLRPASTAPAPAPKTATATELGDFFQYHIEHPVSLPRQKSALLPIVSEEVEGSRVSIYNEATHAKFPLLGLRFKNTTKLHLMQGPITVFDNNSYAGDARILDLQPNEERLLSYAIDLGVEVEPVVREPNEHLVQAKIVKGVLLLTRKVRESKSYTIKNRTEHDRTVLIEHPYRPQYTLVTSRDRLRPEERARDVYRFAVAVPAGKTGHCDVVEEREQIGQTALASIDDQTVRVVVSDKVTSDNVREAIAHAVALKTKLTQKHEEIAAKEKRLTEIGNDQTRLRANLEKVPPSSEAYKRYLKKFDTQETEIEQLQEAVAKLQEQERKQQQDYDRYLADLNVE
jgi:hypothetical protein